MILLNFRMIPLDLYARKNVESGIELYLIEETLKRRISTVRRHVGLLTVQTLTDVIQSGSIASLAWENIRASNSGNIYIELCSIL